MSKMIERVALAILRELQKDDDDFLSDPYIPTIYEGYERVNDEDECQILAETEGMRIFDGGIVVKEIARVVIKAIYESIEENIEHVARAIAEADQEDYMEDYARYDKRAKAAIDAALKD